MSTELAQGVLTVITGLGFIVWLVALQFLIVTYRIGKTHPETDALPSPEQPPGNWLFGSVEVEGQLGALMDRAVSLLVKLGSFHPGAFGPLKIVERTQSRIGFERIGPAAGMQSYGAWYRRGLLSFTALDPGRTRIDYAVEQTPARWLLGLGWAFQTAGLVALTVGCWAVATFCVPSPDPAVRAQTVQMIQVIHFLWPPFLCAGLYRQRKTAVLSQWEALVHNLPYHAE
jgi:hypothetical protein